MWKKVDFPAVEGSKMRNLIRVLFLGAGHEKKKAVNERFHSHAGKPTATMTSVLLEMREADAGSYSCALESIFL